MSDGLSDCAASAGIKARRFVKTNYPELRIIHSKLMSPKMGTVAFIYEEWLQHIVEIVKDRHVIKRYVVEPFKDKPHRLRITNKDWPVGYYLENRLPRKG